FSYIDDKGATQSIDLGSIVKANETVTTLVKDATGNGQYTYTNESGSDVVIDVPADVMGNFEEILKDQNVQEVLNKYIVTNGGNVKYDGSSFSYIDDKGATQSIDLGSIVKANETVTSLVDNKDGSYTYYNESSFDDKGKLLSDAEGVTFSSKDAGSTWKIVSTNNPSFEETEDIFRRGKVIIGADASSVEPSMVDNVDLYVEGNIQTSGKFFTTNSVYADYVFEKYFLGDSSIKTTYEFSSLDYIKNFVSKHYHLPGVTPIGDLEKNSKGYQFDLTELTIQQLEKIEELFLHAIEFDERLNQKNNEVEKLSEKLELLEKRLEKLEKLGDKF
ncbi:hypothetical protein HX055_12100, partial [Myroides odoratimimus]|nr:hypothetical protein [Myroides odoratimimus]